MTTLPRVDAKQPTLTATKSKTGNYMAHTNMRRKNETPTQIQKAENLSTDPGTSERRPINYRLRFVTIFDNIIRLSERTD